MKSTEIKNTIDTLSPRGRECPAGAGEGVSNKSNISIFLSKREGYNGFTVIELLVVVLIIGVLAAVAVPQYQKAVWKAETVRMIAVIDAIDKAQQVYHLSNGTYATDLTMLDIELPAGSSISGNTITYPQFLCRILSNSFKCYFPATHSLYPLNIERYFYPLAGYDNARTLCWAQIGKPRLQQMCQSLGGIHREHPATDTTLYTLD